MIYTSGSTGKPKGAMLSYRNMRGVAWGIAERLEMDARSVHLSYLPLCHVAEQMLSTFVPIYVGSQVNFGESSAPCRKTCARSRPRSSWACRASGKNCTRRFPSRCRKPDACSNGCTGGR